jgi:hypothetical protein
MLEALAMDTNLKVSICFITVILLFGTLLTPIVFAQQKTGQPITVTVTDGVTGKAADGVTTLIYSSSGAEIQNLGTIHQGGKTVSLPPGLYSFIVQIEIFGFPIKLATTSVNTTNVGKVEITISAYFIPIQYLPLLIYAIIIIVIIVILILIIRHFLKFKKTAAATYEP